MPPSDVATQAATETASILRTLIGLIFVAGSIGTALELLLLEHTEDNWQLVPLVILPAGVVLLGWTRAAPTRLSLRLFRGAMVAFVAAGCLGVYWHYQANLEFELEMYPSLAGMELFWKSIHGAMPALAPATMCLLGGLGLAYGYRHPGSKTGH